MGSPRACWARSPARSSRPGDRDPARTDRQEADDDRAAEQVIEEWAAAAADLYNNVSGTYTGGDERQPAKRRPTSGPNMAAWTPPQPWPG